MINNVDKFYSVGGNSSSDKESDAEFYDLRVQAVEKNFQSRNNENAQQIIEFEKITNLNEEQQSAKQELREYSDSNHKSQEQLRLHREQLLKFVKKGDTKNAQIFRDVINKGHFQKYILRIKLQFLSYCIDMLYIRLDYRRSGAGAALVRHIESLCQTPKLFTSTNLSNLPMQSLFQGFLESSQMP